MCIQQSPYKVVEDGSNEGGHQYQSLGLNKTLKQNTPQVHLMLKKCTEGKIFYGKNASQAKLTKNVSQAIFFH